ncbi:helix-turn-helix domain-containing protein [Nitrospirillum pindoramense]|uniref:Putative transcriptional regulator n=1 Tax=Nitrospirillum amazonense TaxID=28077 RepID=A0A560GSD3_9PROT|nr:helix-turn-helix domain-containing protein [Nitrospirillum amazonense]TWB36922.1 putative transcriptional regulator [Nitrospirillum amazonense]
MATTKPSLHNEIMVGLQEAVAHARGEAAGARETVVMVGKRIDVRAIREGTGLTQEAFAARYGFPLAALEKWESGARHPRGSDLVLLTVIDRELDAVNRALTAV